MKLIAIFVSIASLAVLIYAVMYLAGCGPQPTPKEQAVAIASATVVSQNCKEELHKAVVTWDAGCPALLVELQHIADTYPKCVEAQQYAGFRCVPRDGGPHGIAR